MNRLTTLAAAVMLAACARGDNTPADTTAALDAPTATSEAKAAAAAAHAARESVRPRIRIPRARAEHAGGRSSRAKCRPSPDSVAV